MFQPVPAKPDLIASEHEILDFWQDRRIFAKLRAQNAGGPRWSFLDGPITANNPMGVHHAWGRTYKDLFQRFHAMLGEDERFQNGFDCQGLWVEVNVERDLGFTSKRDIETYGIAEFVSLCKQRVLTYAARQTEQSVRLGYWMDWNDPDELRRLRDLLAEDPAQVVTIEGPIGPVTDTVEMIVGRLGMRELGGSLLHFQQREQRPHLGLPRRVPPAGLDLQGSRLDAVVPALRHRPVPDGDERGLRGPRGPGPHRQAAAHRSTRRVPPRLDDDPVDPCGERRRGRGPGAELRQGPPGRRHVLAGARDVSSRRSSASSRSSRNDPGSDLVGWRYQGPYDDLPAVRKAFAGAGPDGSDYEHRVIPWDEVGEEEGTGIVHIAPGAGAEDYQLGKTLGLPAIGPIDESGLYYQGFGWLSGKEAPAAPEAIIDDLERRGILLPPRALHAPLPALLAMRHAAPLPPRRGVVHLDGPGLRQAARPADACGGGCQPALPDHGDRRPHPLDPVVRLRAGARLAPEHARLDDQQEALLRPRPADLRLPGVRHVRRRRWPRGARGAGVEGWETFEGHTPHRPYVDAVKIACRGCGAPVARIPDVGNPWLDAGIVPFSTLHYREDPEYWAQWFPADFITECFPGQFRNWFYAMLAMSTVLRREEPFKTIFGYATLFGEDGRPMHKSWGNAIDFDEAAERMGVDVMRWMFVDRSARRQHPVRLARRRRGTAEAPHPLERLRVLRQVRPAGGLDAGDDGRRSRRPAARAALDRWILSRAAGLAERAEERLRDYDSLGAARAISSFIDDLSTWYLRLRASGSRRNDDAADRGAAFATLHAALVALARVMAPILPFLSESIYRNLAAARTRRRPNRSTSRAGRARTSRPTATRRSRPRSRRPAGRSTWSGPSAARRASRSASRWRGCGWRCPAGSPAEQDALLALIAQEVNVKSVELIGDESELVERRVKPLLPKIGKKLGSRIPAVMAAARENGFEIHADGSVTLGGVTLAADEVEILATPRPGTAVAHDEGLVVVIDTELTDELRAEGDARELQRAIQDLRKDAALELDDRIVVWIDGLTPAVAAHLGAVADETLADEIVQGPAPDGLTMVEVSLDAAAVRVALRRSSARR